MSERRRLLHPSLPEVDAVVRLDAAATAHARVLRLGPGEVVELFDGAGGRALAEVLDADGDGLRVQLRERLPDAVPARRLVLVQALPKAGKLDGIVRMATELGVAEVHLVTTRRTEVRLDRKRTEARLERLARVAREAARQAGRADVPALEAPVPLAAAAARAPGDAVRWVAWEDARGRWPEAGEGGGADAPEGWVVVGPEGGLDRGEVEALAHEGWRVVGLGRHVLRVETAGPVACALLARRLDAARGAGA